MMSQWHSHYRRAAQPRSRRSTPGSDTKCPAKLFSLSRGRGMKSGRGAKLATCLRLLPRLGITGALPPHHTTHPFRTCKATTLFFTYSLTHRQVHLYIISPSTSRSLKTSAQFIFPKKKKTCYSISSLPPTFLWSSWWRPEDSIL